MFSEAQQGSISSLIYAEVIMMLYISFWVQNAVQAANADASQRNARIKMQAKTLLDAATAADQNKADLWPDFKASCCGRCCLQNPEMCYLML